MRLFEADNRFVDDLETLLRNRIGRSDAKQASQTLTWPALSNMLRGFGYGDIDYAGFRRIFDENPSLHSLIRNFNEDGLILGTDEEPESTEQDQMDVPQGPGVDQMAHSGAQKLSPDI
jgi:hypothetical protein